MLAPKQLAGQRCRWLNLAAIMAQFLTATDSGQTGTKCRRSMVSPSEGNEVRRKDCQEFGATRSTVDPGEPPEGPWGGKETPSYELLEGNMPGTPRPEPVSTKQQRIAELARNCRDMAFTTLCITSTWNGCSQPMLGHAETGLGISRS